MSPFSLRRLFGKKLQAVNRPSTKAARARRLPLSLERLEDRVVLTDYTGTLANGLMITGTNNHIIGDVDIPAGATVTVQQGAVVQFNFNTNMKVEGTLNVTGTAGSQVTFTSYRDGAGAGPGDWGAIYFNGGSDASSLNNAVIKYGGYNASTGTLPGEVIVAAPVTLANSTVSNAKGDGIRVNSAKPMLTNDTFASNNGAAVAMTPDSQPAITTPNVGTTNGFNGVLVDTTSTGPLGMLSVDTTWNNPLIPYQLTGTLTVKAGVTLAVGAGQTVEMPFSADLVVNGTLSAPGTAANPVTFTSYRDNSGGSPAPGDWGAIYINAGSDASSLNNAVIKYGGYNGVTGTLAGEVIVAAPVTLSNSTVSNAKGDGIRVNSAKPMLTNDTFANNNGAAVAMTPDSQPTITTPNVGTTNGFNGVLVDTTSTGPLGTLSINTTWNNPLIPYKLTGTLTVAAGVTLTVGAGQTVELPPSANLTVNGTLSAPGTAANPVTFTSYRDNNGGSPGKGDWGAIYFNAGSDASSLNNVVVKYGGYNGSTGTLPGEVIVAAPVTIANSTVSSAYGAGLRITSANPMLTNDTFASNNGAAVAMTPDSQPTISTPHVGTTNGFNGVLVDTTGAGLDTLLVNTTWNNPLIVYQLTGSLTIKAGVTLTVGAGQTVELPPSANLTVNGTLSAPGTAANPVTFTSYRDNNGGSPGKGDWGAIYFNAGSDASSLNNVVVKYGGYNGSTGTLPGEVIVAAPVMIANSTVSSAYGAGLRITSANPMLTNDTFASNNGAAVAMTPDSQPAITTPNVGTTNGFNGVLVDTTSTGPLGTLSVNTTWNNPLIPYQLTGTLTVAAGVTLTVGAGQTVELPRSANLVINGTLAAPGTGANSVTFTSYRDANGPAAADWGAIYFNVGSDASVLQNVVVKYGGYNTTTGLLPGEVIVAAPVTIATSTVSNAYGDGVRVNSAKPMLTNDTFANNNGAAVAMTPDSQPAITTPHVVTTNGFNGVLVDTTSTGALGTLSVNTTWNNPLIPYQLTGTLTVVAGVTLTIGAGQTVELPRSANLVVNGTLTAAGTGANSVTFTSYRDANGPAAGDWGAIYLNPGSDASVLQNVVVKYGGFNTSTGNLPGEIVVAAPVTIANSTVSNSNSAGLAVVSSNPVLSNDTFANNAGAAIGMSSDSQPVITTPHVGTTNGFNGVLVDTTGTLGTLSANTTWSNPLIAYQLTGTLTVKAGVTLEIDPGQTVELPRSANLVVNGTLKVPAGANPVVFTSYRDANGPAAGDWGAIYFNAGSDASFLNNAVVKYGGYNTTTGGLPGAVIIAAPVTLSNSTVSNAYGAGARVNGSNPTLTSDTFTSNNGAAVAIDLASNPAISNVTVTSNGVNGVVADAGTLPASLAWTGLGIVYSLAGDVAVPAGLTLTIGPSSTFGPRNTGNFTGTGTFVNAGTFLKTADAGTMTIAPAFVNTGTVQVENGTLNLTSNLASNGLGILTGKAPGVVAVAGNLGGTTTNANQYAPLAAIKLDGTGTAAAPQTLEVMGRDLGSVAAGFNQNFAYYSLALANGTYVRLVDNVDNLPNAAADGAEALYVDNLVVPSGTTLDLNGLHVYARITQINGTVVGGAVNALGTGGPLTLNAPAPGTLAAGTTDDWTFFARANQAVTLTVETGSAGSPAPLSPTVNYAQITLLDGNTTLGTASNTVTGAEVTLAGAIVPANGYLISNVEKMYHVHVQAPPAQPNSAGNYVIAAWDATTRATPLNLNQTTNGTIDTPFRVDSWTFSATAGQLVQFKLVNTSNASVVFDLTGPNGYTAFTAATASSGILTLPTTGSYAVSVHTLAKQTGSYSFQVVQTAVTPLILETPLNVTVAGGAQSQLFQLPVTQSGQLRITLQDANASDRNEVYVSLNSVPTRGNARYTFTTAASATQQLLIPTAAPGTYYILVYTEAAPSSGGVTLTANEAAVFLTAVTPDHAGNGADATLTVTGVGFDNTATVSLVSSGGTTFPATTVNVGLPTQLTATFTAGAVPAGVYSVKVTLASGATATLPGAFTFVTGGQAVFHSDLIVPSAMGYHIPAIIYIEYSNTGDVAMPAPLLVFRPTQTHADGTTDAKAIMTLDQSLFTGGFWTSALPTGFSNSVAILASGATPGVLQPGESARVPVYYAGWQQPWDFNYPSFNYSLAVVKADDPTPLDWTPLTTTIATAPLSASAWSVMTANFVAQVGQTAGSYVSRLDADASYLGQLGSNVTDTAQLTLFEFQQAAGFTVLPKLETTQDDYVTAPGRVALNLSRSFQEGLVGRNQVGPFGYGWTLAAWEQSLRVDADGTVNVIDPSSYQHVFLPDSRDANHYFAQPGDYETLTPDGAGGYVMIDPNGTTTRFSAAGQLSYIQDANGNRITAGYTSGRLTSLTHSSGQSVILSYNGAGRIISIVDSVGQMTTYTYDATNQYLMSVIDPANHTTAYTYDTGANQATAHALLSATTPVGTHDFYSYDTLGRLKQMNHDGGVLAETFVYNLGLVAASDSLGNTVRTYLDQHGKALKVVNPLNQPTYFTYDQNSDVTGLTNGLGQRETFTYDARGNLATATDRAGNITTMTYNGPFNELASFTNALGNTTRYGYDGKGNLDAITNAAGIVQSLATDPVGNIKSYIDGNGKATAYTRDSAGRLVTETFASGTVYAFTYDAAGNLQTAKGPDGTITTVFDASHNLTKITYPSGQSLTYTYDAGNRRTQMVDQSGFTVNFAYNSLGQLASLTDGSNNAIAQYTYDGAGRLAKQVDANGTYTQITYDAANNVLSRTNFAPDNSVTSKFVYTYNSEGLVATQTTLQGQWTYTYDAIGNLTHAAFASDNVATTPNQDLQYAYDAAGNRTQTVINGVNTIYVSNNLNQYTRVGNTAYTFDGNGNLTTATTGGQTTSYAYNPLNQLVGITAPSVAAMYQYDPLGQQSSSSVGGQITQYLNDPTGFGNVFGTYNGVGQLQGHYVRGLSLTSFVDAAGSHFYATDVLGSTAGVSGPTGAVESQFAYLPYGGVVSSSGPGNLSTFVGGHGIEQIANGLYAMRARVYDPVLGRFLSADPLAVATPQIDVYTYANNHPTSAIDPTGLKTIGAGGSVSGGFFGFGGTVSIGYIRDDQGNWDFQITYGYGVGSPSAGGSFGVTVTDAKDIHETEGSGRQAGGSGGMLVKGGIDVVSGIPDSEGKTYHGNTYSVGLGAPAPGEGHAYHTETVSVKEVVNSIKEDPAGFAKEVALAPFRILFGVIKFVGDTVTGRNVRSHDPNDKIGPAGVGTAGFIPGNGQRLSYRIDFENDPTATAPAQRVTVTDNLDPNFDLNSFALTDVGFGDTLLTVPAGSQHYQTTVSTTQNGKTFQVQIELGLHSDTRQVYATFQSIDPNTQLPPDALTGFLPPEDGAGHGMGHFSYVVNLKPNLPTGAMVQNVALIQFDANGVIATNQADPHDPSKGVDPTKQDLNTIDAGAPTSGITALPSVSPGNFTLAWSGSDDAGGSGVAVYDVFVSDNGGAFTPLLTATALTSTTFNGVNGHAYSFYSVATDNVGHRQATPTTAQATTTVDTVAPTVASITSTTANGTYGSGAAINVTVTFSEPVTLSGGNLTVALNDGGTVTVAPFANSATASGTYTVAAGQAANPLDVTTPLTLAAGATLQDAATNNAVLTVPAGKSLKDNKAIAVVTINGQLAFSAATASVHEKAGIVTLTVNRSGGFDGTVTVQYDLSVASGLLTKYQAVPGTDFTGATHGTVTFNPGDAQKTFSFTVTQDNLVEENKSFILTLSQPTGGATLGSQTSTAVTILDDNLPVVPNATPKLATLQKAGIGFGTSDEHYQQFVRTAYDHYLRRKPSDDEVKYWVGLMKAYQNDHTVGLKQEQIEAGFIDSKEYISRFGSVGKAWVDGIYADLLGRAPDPSGESYWVGQLAKGVDPTLVALGFTTSLERLQNRVSATYQTLLERPADAIGLAYWVGIFNSGGTTEDINSGFVGSVEYYNKANSSAGNPARWVREAYLDVLFRAAKLDELKYWENFLNG